MSVVEQKRPRGSLRGDIGLTSSLRSAVASASAEDAWSHLAAIGQLLSTQPNFDPRNWGYVKLSNLITAMDLFAIKPIPGGFRVRDKVMSR